MISNSFMHLHVGFVVVAVIKPLITHFAIKTEPSCVTLHVTLQVAFRRKCLVAFKTCQRIILCPVALNLVLVLCHTVVFLLEYHVKQGYIFILMLSA